MAMFPISENDIENYLNENLKDIIKKATSVYEMDNSILESIGILPCMNEDILRRDPDGYQSYNEIALGRYISDKEPIKINLEGLQRKIFVLEKIVKKPYAYLLCDLVLIHEFMHVYQEKIEKKELKRDKKVLEEDANAKALKVFCEVYTEPVDIRKKVFDFFLQDSMYKLPDGLNNACI